MTQSTVGAVIIGRNEGERLIACLESLLTKVDHIIYVDSDSHDGSVESAKKMGVSTLALDMTKKFTAARARNAGFKKIIQMHPQLDYIQYVDGDCIVDANWITHAKKFLVQTPLAAIACGRLRELHPEASIYNKFCDIEWNTPIGQTKACGGIALVRVDAFDSVGGFNETLIAGEEPEMCIRIRQAGFQIWRLDYDMAFHDAAIFKFSQWWKRTIRAGYAYAQGSHMHGKAPEYHWVSESRRAWLWGFILPLATILSLCFSPKLAFILMSIFSLQLLRLTLKNKAPFKFALQQSFFTLFGKIAEAIGQLQFLHNRLFNNQGKLIEYK